MRTYHLLFLYHTISFLSFFSRITILSINDNRMHFFLSENNLTIYSLLLIYYANISLFFISYFSQLLPTIFTLHFF